MKPLPVIYSTIIMLLLFTGCKQETLRFREEPGIKKNPNQDAPLSAVLKFETNKPVETTIQLTNGDNSWKLRYDTSANLSEGLPVYGMRPGKEHEIKITIKHQDEQLTYKQPLTYTPPELPDAPASFPKIMVKHKKQEKMSDGVTLFNPRRRTPKSSEFGQNFGMLVMVDHNGEVVWYYQTDSRISDYNFLDNGRISYLTQDYRLVEIDMLGNVHRTWYAANRPQDKSVSGIPVEAKTFHHDAYPMPNGNYLILTSDYKTIPNYYTSEREANAPRKTQKVMGDIIREFTPEGKVIWEWNTFNHLDPMRIGYETFSRYWYNRGFPGVIDWSHANSLFYDSTDNSVIVNFRYQSALMKIDRESKNIKWIFGEPSGYADSLKDKIIRLKSGNWFWHQHGPTLTPQGTILLFDNGNYQARPFKESLPPAQTLSKAVEYKIDEKTFTASKVWSSELPDEENIVSIAMGDVDWLEEKQNVLVSYGALLSQEHLNEITWWNRRSFNFWTMIREFNHTDPNELLWELQITAKENQSDIGWNIFRAERIEVFD